MSLAITETNTLCHRVERVRRERSQRRRSVPRSAAGKLNGELYNIDFASVQSRQRAHRNGKQLR
jgi:hypothetical protein